MRFREWLKSEWYVAIAFFEIIRHYKGAWGEDGSEDKVYSGTPLMESARDNFPNIEQFLIGRKACFQSNYSGYFHDYQNQANVIVPVGEDEAKQIFSKLISPTVEVSFVAPDDFYPGTKGVICKNNFFGESIDFNYSGIGDAIDWVEKTVQGKIFFNAPSRQKGEDDESWLKRAFPHVQPQSNDPHYNPNDQYYKNLTSLKSRYADPHKNRSA